MLEMKLLVRGETRLTDICNKIVCVSELNCCQAMDEGTGDVVPNPGTSLNYRVIKPVDAV